MVPSRTGRFEFVSNEISAARSGGFCILVMMPKYKTGPFKGGSHG